MGRPARIIKRSLLGLLSVIVVAVATVLIAMHTDWGRAKLRDQIARRMNEAFVGGATVGRLEGSPLGELVLHDVVINGPDRKPAITIKRLELDVALLPLFSKQARIAGLTAEDVDIDLRRDANGDLQFSDLLHPGPRSGWSIVIPDVVIKRAHVRFDRGDEVMNFDAIHLAGDIDMPNGKPLEASFLVQGTWRERAAPLWLDASVNAGDEVVEVPSLILRAGEVGVFGAGVKIHKPVTPGLRDDWSIALEGRPPRIDGVILIDARRDAVAQLVPELDLPGDLQLAITSSPLPILSSASDLQITGTVDGDPIAAFVRADFAAPHAVGYLATGRLDATKLTRGRLEGKGSALIVFDVKPGEAGQLPTGTLMIHAAGDFADVPGASATIAVTSAGERAATAMTIDGKGLTAKLGAQIRKTGDAIALERGRLIARSGDPARATGGKAPLHGAVAVDLRASGALSPRLDLAVAGSVEGKRLRFADLRVATLHATIDARHLPSRPVGRAKLAARDVVRGDMFLRELDIDAADRPDGRIFVSTRSRPKTDPWLIEADALVTPAGRDGVWTIDLERHLVRAGNGAEWTGSTGQLAIHSTRIEVRDLATASRDGKLAVAGTYHRTGRRAGDLVAKVDAKALTLDNVSKRYRGTIDAHVDVARTDGRFSGIAELHAKGLALDPKVVSIDADAKIEARADKLAIQATATGTRLGRAAIDIDIDAPRDVANVDGWRRLHRDAIRTGRLRLEAIDVGRAAQLAGLPGEYRGQLDGDIQVSATTAGGAIQIRDLVTPEVAAIGPITGQLQLSQTALDQLTSTATAQLGTIGKLDAHATVNVPDHLFDPVAWQRLGRGAIKNAAARIEDIVIDPTVLDRFGYTTELRGRAALVAEITEAARSAKLGVEVRDLRGSPLAEPIAISMQAEIDGTATTAKATVTRTPRVSNGRAGTPPASTAPTPAAPITLATITGRIPLTLAQLEADPRGALDKELTARALLPDVPAPQLLGVFGRTEVIGGVLTGTVDVSGTVGKPIVRALLAGTNLEVPPGPGGKPVKVVKRITLDARWDGAAGRVEIDGVQQGGSLHLLAEGNLFALGAAKVSLDAKQFDLVPILAFLPGPAGGAAGRLDANLTVVGLDPKTAKLAGELHLTDARVPIAPQVGTLRRAKIDIVVRERDVKIDVDGRLGGGTVKVAGTIGMDGTNPSSGDATITLRKVSPIGVVEPRIDADITAKVRRDGHWIADIEVKNAVIKVPSGRGEELKPVGAPSDMVFVTGGEPATRRKMLKQPPARPMLTANIRLRSTYVESDEMRGLIKGRLEVTTDGVSVGIVGQIEADRGDLDLFGRRYQLERAAVRFDGSTDPLVDVQISHDFPEVTTVTTVRGRLSKPELIMSSDPATYSQGQLLGFLLGGEPDGQPSDGNPREQAAQAGASIIANKIGGYVKDAMPIDIDVLRYEAATSTSGAAVTVGTWLSRSLFVAYRRRIEARPDENAGEGEIEYWIARRVVVEGVVGDRGYNGVDLLWRKRY